LEWNKHVVIDSALFRPEDPPVLLGDASKARTKLGWEPEISFTKLVWMMTEEDLP
jgi:GDPmannose 4,6-dehydratase